MCVKTGKSSPYCHLINGGNDACGDEIGSLKSEYGGRGKVQTVGGIKGKGFIDKDQDI